MKYIYFVVFSRETGKTTAEVVIDRKIERIQDIANIEKEMESDFNQIVYNIVKKCYNIRRVRTGEFWNTPEIPPYPFGKINLFFKGRVAEMASA
jgi:hypothetical protein